GGPADGECGGAQRREVRAGGGRGFARRGTHVGDVGRQQREDASRGERQQAGEKRQGQVDDHPAGLDFSVPSWRAQSRRRAGASSVQHSLRTNRFISAWKSKTCSQGGQSSRCALTLRTSVSLSSRSM